MSQAELFERLAVALAIGLLIGLERGWQERDQPEGENALGVRTLGLAGLLGGVSGALALAVPGGAALLAAAFAAYAVIVSFFRYREMRHDGTFGATTVLAALLAFALGALAVVSDVVAAAAGGVAVAGLLAMKPVMHGWLRAMTWPELRAAIVLLTMSVILLPILPDRDMGPLGALNPRQIWLMTILIAAVSSIGYVAIRLLGSRRGVVVSGLAGGLVSSTAVTLTFARLAREHPAQAALLIAGALLAGATMMGRVLVVAGIINAGLVRWIALPLIAAAAVQVGSAWLLSRRHEDHQPPDALPVSSPFELGTVLTFGAFLALVMVLAKVAALRAGRAGAYALAVVSGVADVDAITLTMARLGGSGIDQTVAAGAILLAVAVNTIAKAVLGTLAGGREAGSRLLPLAAASLAAGAAAFAITLWLDPLGALL